MNDFVLYHINHNHIRIRIIKIISRNCENFITHPFFKKMCIKGKNAFFFISEGGKQGECIF